MARKGLLTSIIDEEFTAVNSDSAMPTSSRPSSTSAFGMMSRAAAEMASKIDAAEELERQLLAGQAIVEIDPDLVDDSFVDDRLKESREEIEDLVETFRERGQDTPILVRPHRDVDGRFETIFGHRRKRAAKATGRKVRAVVRQLSDRDHVIAQGQENAARSGLSFIEKAMFASNLGERKFDNQTIMASLRINKTVLSKMQAVATQIPIEVIQAIGPAADIGRDRWYELAGKLRELGSFDEAITFVQQPIFRDASGATRFNNLCKHLDSIPQPSSSNSRDGAHKSWEPKDHSVRVTTKGTKNAVTIALRRPDGVRFGHWISENLESLYSDFRRTGRKTTTGD